MSDVISNVIAQWIAQGLVRKLPFGTNVYLIITEDVDMEALFDIVFDICYNTTNNYHSYEVEGIIYYFYWTDPSEA